MRVKAIPKARMKDSCPRVPSTAELSSFSRALVPCQVVLLPSDLLTSCLSCYITHKLSVPCLLFYHFLQSGMLYFTVPHSSSLPLLYYLFVHPALSHGCGIWAPGTSSEVPAPLARAALSYAGCLVTALITQVAKFSLKKKDPRASQQPQLEQGCERGWNFPGSGALPDLLLSVWKAAAKPRQPP